MYIKQNDVIIINRLEELPLEELKIGKQIITFEDVHIIGDKTITNLLVEKQSNIYLFEKNANITGTSYHRNSYLESTNYDSLYLEFNGKLHLISNEKSCDISNQTIDFENEDEDNVLLAKLYNLVYIKEKIKMPSSFRFNENKYCQFMAFDLNENSAIVFITVYNINFECKKLSSYQTVTIVNKDKTVHSLEDFNYHQIKTMLKESGLFYDFYFDSFLDKIDEASKFNVYDYLNEKVAGKNDGFENFRQQLLLFYSYELESLFSPIFINEEQEFYIYPSSLRNNEIGHFCYLGKNENGFYNEKVDVNNIDNDLKEDIRIAKAIRQFDFNEKNGLSPYDGKIYKDGIESSNDNYKILYRDHDSIIYLNKDTSGVYLPNREYFLKIKNHYIRLFSGKGNSKDQEKIDEINERMKVMEQLTEEN